MMQFNWHNLFYAALPINIIIVMGFLVLLLGLFCRGKSASKLLLILSLAGVGASVASTLHLWSQNFSAEIAMLSIDSFAYFFYLLLLAISFLSILAFFSYFKKQDNAHPEIFSLSLFSLSGMMVMVSTTHLLLFFLGLEVMSLAIYALVGIKRNDARSNEAAMKYFILGAMIAGFLLYGMSLLYGTTGTLDTKALSSAHKIPSQMLILKIGILLVMVTFAFKVAAVPFHFWAPDVYEGAPLPVTGFMSTAVKAAAFGSFIRIVQPLSTLQWWDVGILVGVLSLTTMVVGNLVALYQTNIKRMLAYSSIAHAGYVLVGVTTLLGNAPLNSELLAAPLFYLFAYSVITLGAFAIASNLATAQDDRAELNSYYGLSKRSPFQAAAMAVFMLALTGIPPTVGFVGKFYIFREALNQGLYILVIVGVLMSAVSAYYYLRVIVAMYFVKEEHPHAVTSSQSCWILGFITFICLLSTLYFGICPSNYFQFMRSSISLLP